MGIPLIITLVSLIPCHGLMIYEALYALRHTTKWARPVLIGHKFSTEEDNI